MPPDPVTPPLRTALAAAEACPTGRCPLGERLLALAPDLAALPQIEAIEAFLALAQDAIGCADACPCAAPLIDGLQAAVEGES
ncbi:hypothetical protein [Caenispirillum bisanense]|uniref:Uncharacterized protein n=1 Tax=Caenispirillum bisanense TaxID=414052 RepID=A0A286GIN9_9PROT|nr:hypothetical protein [Caenispirillum bisanense]SOD95391.1 hypothetical protein SAMN05421508_104324 [Caenispirillum bisanense]